MQIICHRPQWPILLNTVALLQEARLVLLTILLVFLLSLYFRLIQLFSITPNGYLQRTHHNTDSTLLYQIFLITYFLCQHIKRF